MNRRDRAHDALAARLSNEGRSLEAALAPEGALLRRVRAELDAGGRDVSAPPSPSTGSRFGVAGVRTLAAAALLLVVLLPRPAPAPSLPGPTAAPSTPLPLLAASELERLHPVRLLQALPEPLTALMGAEADEVRASALRVGAELLSRLPGPLREGIERRTRGDGARE